MCGVAVESHGAEVTVHPGPIEPFGFRVPGDLSSAAFFLALAASRPGWRVCCAGLGLNPGRTGILDVLDAMGAQVMWTRTIRPVGWSRSATSSPGRDSARGHRLGRAHGALHRRAAGHRGAGKSGRGGYHIRDAAELRHKEFRIASQCSRQVSGFSVSGARAPPNSLDGSRPGTAPGRPSGCGRRSPVCHGLGDRGGAGPIGRGCVVDRRCRRCRGLLPRLLQRPRGPAGLLTVSTPGGAPGEGRQLGLDHLEPAEPRS